MKAVVLQCCKRQDHDDKGGWWGWFPSWVDNNEDELTLLLPTKVARAMVTCKAQRTEGPPLKAQRRPLGVCPRPQGARFGAILASQPARLAPQTPRSSTIPCQYLFSHSAREKCWSVTLLKCWPCSADKARWGLWRESGLNQASSYRRWYRRLPLCWMHVKIAREVCSSGGRLGGGSVWGTLEDKRDPLLSLSLLFTWKGRISRCWMIAV